MKKCLFLLCTFLFLSSNLVFGQHYTDWTGFEYEIIEPETGTINPGVYELIKDYTISLPEFFLDDNKMPKVTTRLGVDNYRGDAEYYHNWAMILPPIEWDFIRLELGGILTIKKGYRWDGASNPISLMEHWNYRSSLVHDALYDLMRMGYLKPDKHHHAPVWVPVIGWVSLDTHILWDGGDKNRAMADIIHFIIAWQDGDSESGANKDFKVLRSGGGYNSHNDDLLCSWKYHVSELAAYATDGKVELKWQRANEAGKQPYSVIEQLIEPKIIGYDIFRNGQKIATVDAINIISSFPPSFEFITSYTDIDVSNNGNTYAYKLKPHQDNDNQDDWSNVKYSVPLSGAGNALKLDGNNDYMESNTTSNDLCYDTFFNPLLPTFTMEAWVYPEEQTKKSAILSFNTISGKNYNLFMYDGDNQRFCYYDDKTSYVSSNDVYPEDNWYHVAVTIDMMGEGILYVNGQEQASFITPVRPRHGARFSIGQEWDNDKASNFFKGQVDEVRIWNDARTQDKLKENMYHPLRGDEHGLVALWHFNEPENATWFYTDDATVNDNIGTLLGYANSDYPFVSSGAMVPDTIVPDTVITETSEGFVTGGGWINSPEGAFEQKPNATGKANFGFVCKYKKDGETLKGNTTFHFNKAKLKFKSTSYDSLSINGSKAVFKGSGTIDKEGNYGFMISVIDGDLYDIAEEDRFRIKIWDKKDSTVIYDNEIDVGEDEYPTTVLRGGSIVIHIKETENDLIPEDELTENNNEDIVPKMLIYPNPVKDYLTVGIIGNEDKKVQLKIYNSLGKLIHFSSGTGIIKLEINVSDYNSGLYLVIAIVNGETITQKILINK